MLKLLFTLECPQLPALKSLHELVTEALGNSDGDIQKLADMVLAGSRPLVASKALDDGKLIIKLHKVRSTEWNILLVKYRDYPHRYQCEIEKKKPQISLFR